MGFISSMINAGVNMYGIQEQSRIAEQNLAFQKDNLAYQKQLQQNIFNREDNAVQRRAEDLEAAGLSKTLAAGSAAGAGQAIQTEAPQKSDKYAQSLARFSTDIDLVGSVINLMKQQADVSRTKAEAKLLNAQADHFSPIFGSSNSWVADFYRFLENSGVDMSGYGQNIGSVLNKLLGLIGGNLGSLPEKIEEMNAPKKEPFSFGRKKSTAEIVGESFTWSPLDLLKEYMDSKLSSFSKDPFTYGPMGNREWIEKHDPDWVYNTDRGRYELKRYGYTTRR